MTITRLWQSGAEWNEIGLEWDSVSGAVASSTRARTGTYGFRASGQDYMRKTIPGSALAQARVSFHINHSGVALGTPRLVALRSGSTYVASAEYDAGGGNVVLKIGSTAVATASAGALGSSSTWIHCGLDVKLAASGGWIYFYLNGALAASFDGDTSGAGSTVDGLQLASGSSMHQWTSFVFFDDIYLDSSVGESLPAALPDRRFVFVQPTAAGSNTEWTPLSGDNYAAVDERPQDGDTTYVAATVADKVDTYGMANVTVDTGWQIVAAVAQAVAKKTDASASQFKFESLVGVDSASSSAVDLSTSYALYTDRQTSQPDASDWNETDFNAAEFGVRSAGTF
ncbi:MAG: hypothetical protein WBO46_18985 [Caldilineaceae bacterium]